MSNPLLSDAPVDLGSSCMSFPSDTIHFGRFLTGLSLAVQSCGLVVLVIRWMLEWRRLGWCRHSWCGTAGTKSPSSWDSTRCYTFALFSLLGTIVANVAGSILLLVSDRYAWQVLTFKWLSTCLTSLFAASVAVYFVRTLGQVQNEDDASTSGPADLSSFKLLSRLLITISVQIAAGAFFFISFSSTYTSHQAWYWTNCLLWPLIIYFVHRIVGEVPAPRPRFALQRLMARFQISWGVVTATFLGLTIWHLFYNIVAEIDGGDTMDDTAQSWIRLILVDGPNVLHAFVLPGCTEVTDVIESVRCSTNPSTPHRSRRGSKKANGQNDLLNETSKVDGYMSFPNDIETGNSTSSSTLPVYQQRNRPSLADAKYSSRWVLFIIALFFQLFLGIWAYHDTCVNSYGYIGWSAWLSRWCAKQIEFAIFQAIILVCTRVMHKLSTSAFSHIIFIDNPTRWHKFIGAAVMVYALGHVIGHIFNFARVKSLSHAEPGTLDAARFAAISADALPGLRDMLAADSPMKVLSQRCVWTGCLLILCLFSLACSGLRLKIYRWTFKLSHSTMFLLMLALMFVHGSGKVLDTWPYVTFAFTIVPVGVVIFEAVEWHRGWFHPQPFDQTSFEVADNGEYMKVDLVMPRARDGERQWTGAAGNFIYVRCKAIEYWLSHPFSISSMKETTDSQIVTIFVKRESDWTKRLRNLLHTMEQKLAHKKFRLECPLEISAGIHTPASYAVIRGGALRTGLGLGPTAGKPESHHLLLGMGVGITPMVSLWQSLYGQNDVKSLRFEWKVSKDAERFVSKVKEVMEQLPDDAVDEVKRRNGGLIRKARACLSVKTRKDATPDLTLKPVATHSHATCASSSSAPTTLSESHLPKLEVFSHDSTRDEFFDASLSSIIKEFVTNVDASSTSKQQPIVHIYYCGPDAGRKMVLATIQHLTQQCKRFLDVCIVPHIEHF